MSAVGLRVEVAFNAGYRTAAASRTWTDVTDYAELRNGISIGYGRQDEFSVADANSWSGVLDNSDARFTWGNASSPYYPNVLRGRPVRHLVNFCSPGDGGTFEADATGWSGSNAAVARSTAQAHSGAASLSVTASTAANMTAQTASGTSGIPVAPETDYQLTAWFLRGSVNRTCDLRIDWYDSAGALISTSSSAGITDSATWSSDLLAATSPALSAYARLRLRILAPGAGEVHYVDDVRFEQIRYTGFIDGWPVSWPGGGDSYAVVNLQAASRMARLGVAQKLRSVIEQEILADGPVAYYTMGEGEGATQANDSSGNGAPAMVRYWYTPSAYPQTAPVFGSATGPGTDGLTAVTLAGVAGVSVPSGLAVTLPSTTLAGVGFFFNAANSAAVPTPMFGTAPDFYINLNSTGNLRAQVSGSPDIVSSASYGDGQTHHVFVVQNGANVDMYADGVYQGSTAGTLPTITRAGLVHDVDTATVTGAHLALYDTAPSATRIAAIADAGLTGFAGETTDERLERYAGWASIPSDEIVTTASAVTLDHIPSDEQTALDLMRKVETAEAGVLHDDRDGKLRLRTRSDRYGAAVAVTLDASTQEVGVDFAPTVDGQSLYNVGEGKNLDGTVTATHTNEASRTEYGDHVYSVETASDDDDEPLQLIAWVVNANASPRPRVPVVTVDMWALSAKQTALVAALDIGSLIELENLPDQTPGGTTQQFFVEGYSETFNVGEWSITFNLSPSYPIDSIWTLDDPVLGVLDAGNVLGL